MMPQPTPTIARTLEDGTLVELVHDIVAQTTALAVARPGLAPSVEPRIELPNGEVLVPYSATNNLLTSGCVRLPSTIGSFDDTAQLVGDLRAFLHTYVDLSPVFEEIAANYVLLSWVYDAFNEVPMLRLRGAYGSGKSRALLAIGSLCYNAFFASGASTVSPIFHILDAFGGTLALDEADLRFSDAKADLVKILNNGTARGLPVLRTMANRHRELNPTAFRVFGPKIVAMREQFEDDALESRFLTEDMGVREMRPDIPLTTPDSLRQQAGELRNRLLGWRFAMRGRVAVDPGRAIAGLSPRGNQMALPLLALVDDEAARARIGERLARDEAKAQNVSAPHLAVLDILDRAFTDGKRSSITVSALTAKFNAERDAALPVKSVGYIVRRRLGLETRKSAGIYVIPASERVKVVQLAARYRPADSPA